MRGGQKAMPSPFHLPGLRLCVHLMNIASRQQVTMTQTDRLIIDFGQLEWTAPGAAQLAATGRPQAEIIASCLMRVIRSRAQAEAQASDLQPVSVNLDMTGALAAGRLLEFDSETDRQTRTLVFAHGSARQDGQTVMTATAVYRIES